MAGAFFAFSTFVMRALGKLAPVYGIAAMQSINIVVINRWFMTALFGTAAACVLLIILSLSRWQDPGVALRLAGSLFYLVGTILVTMVFNVPRNNALAAVNPASDESSRLWADYLLTWTAWNHVRTISAFVAAVALSFAFCQCV